MSAHPTAGPARRSPSDLPVWPLAVFFAGFPIWWMAGLAPFLIGIIAVPMTFLLLARARSVRLPVVLLPWFVFLLFALASGVMVDSLARGAGFVLRMSNYLGATVALVYAYNARRSLPVPTMAGLVTLFWVVVVAGGWLGVVVPQGSLQTPVSLLLPDSLMSNQYVQDLVIPKFAELQSPWGSPEVFARPSAPFAYTNGWGFNFALTTPFAVYTMLRHPHRWVRAVIGGVLAAAVVPAAATLNRGMLLALAVAGTYTVLRLTLRGRLAPAALLGAAGIMLVAGLQLLGFGSGLAVRAEYSQSIEGRWALYTETVHAVMRSPLLGYGAPRPSEHSSVSLGTQGHLWNVMFSHGLVALVAFELFFVAVVWRTRRAPTAEHLLPHVVVVTAVVTHVYYGLDGPELLTILASAGLALRMRPPPRALTRPTSARRVAVGVAR